MADSDPHASTYNKHQNSHQQNMSRPLCLILAPTEDCKLIVTDEWRGVASLAILTVSVGLVPQLDENNSPRNDPESCSP